MATFFWLALILGGGLSVVSLFGDFFDADADADADVAAEGHVDHEGLRILSLRSATYFLFAFGAVGVLLQWAWAGRAPWLITAAAAATGVVAAVFSAYLFNWLRRTESGGMPEDSTLVGLSAQVVLPIQAGAGKIVVTRGGREYELLARPFDAGAAGADRWTQVVVVDITDGTALVAPYDESVDPVLPPSQLET